MLEDLEDAVNRVILAVSPKLYDRNKFATRTLKVALDEGLRAIEGGSFNNYTPQNWRIWEIMSGPIRVEDGIEKEHFIILIALTRDIARMYFESLDLKYVTDMVMIARLRDASE